MDLKGEFILDKNKSENNPSPQGVTPPEPQPAAEEPVPPSLKHDHQHQKPGPFTAFCYYPEGVHVEDQQENEEVILLVRKHFVTNTSWVLMLLGILIAPLILLPVTPQLLGVLFLPPLAVTIMYLFYYLIALGFFLVNFSIWYFHVGIVTTTRVIDMDVTSILLKHVAETRISEILDVSYAQNGVIRSFFNYGDIHVQTEGIQQNFEFEACPRPNDVTRIISDLGAENHTHGFL